MLGIFDRLKKEDPMEWIIKSDALCQLGRYEEAIMCYDEALRLRPDHSSAWNNKGEALEKLGRHEEAKKAREQAKKLEK